MIGRLLGMVATLLIYFFAATLIALLVISLYLWSKWDMNREKMAQIVAIAQGVESTDQSKPSSDLPDEQPSHAEIISERASKSRDIEMRELELKNSFSLLRSQQTRLIEEREILNQRIKQFDTQLADLADEKKIEGHQAVLRVLESIKPKQAKIQLIEMLENDEMDAVVRLILDMQDSKKAKIITEFKDEPDNKKVAEVLQRIRKGAPVATLAEDALGQNTPP